MSQPCSCGPNGSHTPALHYPNWEPLRPKPKQPPMTRNGDHPHSHYPHHTSSHGVFTSKGEKATSASTTYLRTTKGGLSNHRHHYSLPYSLTTNYSTYHSLPTYYTHTHSTYIDTTTQDLILLSLRLHLPKLSPASHFRRPPTHHGDARQWGNRHPHEAQRRPLPGKLSPLLQRPTHSTIQCGQ
jgi:hypothetical protein